MLLNWLLYAPRSVKHVEKNAKNMTTMNTARNVQKHALSVRKNAENLLHNVLKDGQPLELKVWPSF